MESISLNGTWRLLYGPDNGGMPGTPAELAHCTWAEVPAEVPGNFELDLFRAGVEKDPFYGKNLYDYRKYEYYGFWYIREFDFEGEAGDWRLQLDGVNTYAEVYLNGTNIGSCSNMMIAYTLPAGDALRRGRNELAVCIRSAMNWARKKDYPVLGAGAEGHDEMLFQRKPPHSFGWDIMPRFPSAGLWRDVSLVRYPSSHITQTYYTVTRADEKQADIVWRYRFETDATDFEGFEVRVTGVCGDSTFSFGTNAPFVSGGGWYTVSNPRLWWPKGYGEAALYNVRMELLHYGEVVDVREERIGLRHIELDHRMEPGDAGEFLIKVNGCPILAKGSNWVPLDAMHSRDASRLQAAHDLLEEAGCNIVRCWGGNVYEDHAFFDLCDERGMLVWQDFAMACGIYPQEEELFRALEEEAAHVIRKFRNHPCILLWAGDNEVDEGYVGRHITLDSNRYNEITRRVLPRMVRLHDPYRLFLPSSPYIPEGFPQYQVPEQHNWGARAYFKDDFYKHSNAHFISECGYHGCPDPASLARYIPEDKLWPWNNDVWETHATSNLQLFPRYYSRNKLMADQVDILFGSVPDSLEEFALLSQVSQAEAKKFFIERTRIKKWRRTGIIWWNMLDGWPQISDAVVDYYYAKKRAFHYIKRVQRPICVMMDELRDWDHEVILGNDSRESRKVTYRVEDGDTGEVVMEGSVMSPANENVSLGHVRVHAGRQKLYIFTWEVDGRRYGNHYITGYPPYDPAQMKVWLQKIDALPDGEPV